MSPLPATLSVISRSRAYATTSPRVTRGFLATRVAFPMGIDNLVEAVMRALFDADVQHNRA